MIIKYEATGGSRHVFSTVSHRAQIDEGSQRNETTKSLSKTGEEILFAGEHMAFNDLIIWYFHI
jgi:hypothetical protein